MAVAVCKWVGYGYEIRYNYFMDEKGLFAAFGVKPTAVRLAVLGALQAHARLSAREAWGAVQKQKPSVGFTSVYRALSVLHEAGLLRKIPSEQGALYEYHEDEVSPQLVCSRCGKVEEIDDPAVLAYNASVVKKRGLANSDALLMYADCRKKNCDSES